MNNQQRKNQHLMGSLGLPIGRQRKEHIPSKKDLFELLKNLRFKEPPNVLLARDNVESATDARREFERKNKTWRQLRKRERDAQRDLQRIEVEELEQWRKEIAKCFTTLRLHGVTPELVKHIEQLVYREEE